MYNRGLERDAVAKRPVSSEQRSPSKWKGERRKKKKTERKKVAILRKKKKLWFFVSDARVLVYVARIERACVIHVFLSSSTRRYRLWLVFQVNAV